LLICDGGKLVSKKTNILVKKLGYIHCNWDQAEDAFEFFLTEKVGMTHCQACLFIRSPVMVAETTSEFKIFKIEYWNLPTNKI
jgi:hypothetical protein